ncbi:MAG: hypothetical protein GY754_02955 [bacterium]|nr:hypothetical protein [bacterium]
MVGEKCIAKGIITQDQLDKALAEQKSSGGKVGEVIVKLGFATKDQVEDALK